MSLDALIKNLEHLKDFVNYNKNKKASKLAKELLTILCKLGIEEELYTIKFFMKCAEESLALGMLSTAESSLMNASQYTDYIKKYAKIGNLEDKAIKDIHINITNKLIDTRLKIAQESLNKKNLKKASISLKSVQEYFKPNNEYNPSKHLYDDYNRLASIVWR